MFELPEKALENRVILISGNESALRQRALQELKAVAHQDDGLDTETFEAGESPAQDWLAAASTLPFFAERRTVFVRHLLRGGDPKEVFESGPGPLASLPESALLVLVADDEVGDDQKQKTLERWRDSWDSFITKAGGLAVNFAKSTDDIKVALKKQISSEGKTITPRALDLLVEMTGSSYSRAIEECEKLMLFIGDVPQISESDVQAVVVPSREWNVFKLVDAIVAANLGLAMTQLRNLVSGTSKPEAAAFQQIFPNLSSNLRLIWQARLCVESKCSPLNAPESVRSMFPAKGDLSKEKDWRQKKSMGAARSMTLPKIRACLTAVADADARMKGSGYSFSAIETLEQTVMKMVAAVKGVGH